MNIPPSMRWISPWASLVIATAVLWSGCGPKQAAPSAGNPDKLPVVVKKTVSSAEKTSFAEVTAQLDPGGTLFGYVSTARWLDGLSVKLEPWRDLILSMPEMGASEAAQIRKVFDVIGALVKRSGLESISGIGMSGIALEPGYYQSKLVVHHYPGKGEGYLWTWFGAQEHGFDFADWLPTNTVWAATIDLDVPGIWRAVREHAQQAGIPEVLAQLDQFSRHVEAGSGMKMDELLSSMAGEFGVALTLDPAKPISIPLPNGQTLQPPEPGIILAMKVRDDRWFDWTAKAMASHPQVIDGDNKELSLRMRTVPVPLPVPLELRASVARAGDYLWVTSHDQLMKTLAQVHAGKLAGLKSTPEFKKLTDGLPAKGNQFAFASENLQAIVKLIQQAAMAASGQGGGPPPALLEKLFAETGKLSAASVGVKGPQGWITVQHGHQQPADALLLPAVIAPVAIMAGITLPALAKAKNKARTIMCVNNLKQLGLAAHIHANDHEDIFPPDILSMKATIVSPRVLICPDDPKAQQASNLTWETIRIEEIAYEYLGAGKKAGGGDAQATLFRCRIHGHVCRMDGSVQQAPFGRAP